MKENPIFNNYKYATGILVLSKKPLKNPFGKEDLVIGMSSEIWEEKGLISKISFQKKIKLLLETLLNTVKNGKEKLWTSKN